MALRPWNCSFPSMKTKRQMCKTIRMFPIHHFFKTFDAQHKPVSTQTVKNLPTMQETWIRALGQEDPLEKEIATHSSRIPLSEEPGGLQSMGSQKVGHNWVTNIFNTLSEALKAEVPVSFTKRWPLWDKKSCRWYIQVGTCQVTINELQPWEHYCPQTISRKCKKKKNRTTLT